jgi:hypothetical protein
MASAAVKRYWDWLSLAHSSCVCGAMATCLHHIIHLNGQRITKDDMLVIGLCQPCHQGKGGVHDLGGERQFQEATGWDLVELATLRRHNFEVRQ